MNFDLVIKNGIISDGSGNPSFKSDIYVNDGKIAKITRLNVGKADEIIDAKGFVVTPGFIDIHQHSDFTLFGCPKCDSYIHQGVTTISIGNCGLSPAPLSDDYKEDLKLYYESFTLGLDMPYKWHSFGGFLEELEKAKPGVNVWPQVGHCSLRAAVMGFDARKANDRELEAISELLEQSMKDGAAAMSVGWYAPTFWADTNEIIELAKVVIKYGGIYTTHLRSSPMGVDEAFKVGEKSGIPVEIAHYGSNERARRGIREARARGIEVTYDAYPYCAGSSLLGQFLPYQVYEGGVNAMLERIEDKKLRDNVKEQAKARGRTWDRNIIAWVPNKNSKKYEGMSIKEAARSEKTDPVDFICDLLIENEGTGMHVSMNGRRESFIFKTLQDPNHYVMSDGWGLAPYEPIKRGIIHPRAYGSFPRVLGLYVREFEAIPLQEAIRKMTWGPAQKMGIWDRGLLREGMWADITIFDPNTVIDKATFMEPHQYPVGIEYVIVNGKVVIENGEHTEVRSGKILRRS